MSFPDSRSLTRFRANQLLHVCFPEGVDLLTKLAISIFDLIPPNVLPVSAEVSDRDVFYKAVEFWLTIVQLAFANGRSDLERMGNALHAGLVALDERKKGFDEPLFRARRRLRQEPRDTYYIRQLKVLASEACYLLQHYGRRDATSQVAKVIDRGNFLPAKRNGMSIGARSVLNWTAQRKKRAYYHWQFRPQVNRFPEATAFWGQGRREAAQQAVLRELAAYLKGMGRFRVET
jgi:hypothetical protein